MRQLSPCDRPRRPHDATLRPIAAAPDGITLTQRLAERLEVKAGDVIAVGAMEGRRRKRDLPVSAIVDESIGMASYVEIETLNRFTDEGAVISAASLYVEPTAMPALGQKFKNLPTIESVTMKEYTLSSFMEKIAGLVFVTAGILAAFATIITVGVVYNSARISLQERAWELASLRVLRLHSSESFEIPAVIAPQTYFIAAGVVLAAAAASAYIVKGHVDQLDLVAALKTRE
ncbi:ABC transporter permease [Bradyrhizobium cenepequi]